jgi:hypothetical protein
VIRTGCGRGGGGVEMAGHRWARHGGGGAPCEWCFGAETRGERWGEVRWRVAMAAHYIGAEGEAAAGD